MSSDLVTPGPPRAPTRASESASVPPGVRLAFEWAWRLILVAVALYGLVRLIQEFADIVIPVLISMLVAALLHPIVDRVARHVSRALATILTMLGAFLLVAALLALVGQQAASGFGELRAQGIEGVAQVQEWLSTGPLHLASSRLEGYVTKAQDAVEANQSTIVSGAVGVASTATHLAEGAFIALFSTFFFLSSGSRIWAWLLRLLPRAARAPVDDAGLSGWVTLSHYVRATLIVAVTDGLGVGIGAAVLGVPLAIPLGVVVFLGAFIPVVGALLSGVLAVLIALVANGPVTALIMLGVVLLVQQVEAHVLQPFLLGRAVSVHPVAVILGIATGAAVAGIVGALFAVPLIAVANTMVTALAAHGHQDPGERVDEDDAALAPDKPAPTDLSQDVHTEPAATAR